mmetsp:Transcript_2133/g.5852  ORF Transcript_2133/g.5852 Transcript_2133/m.5852 type:complete len:234 (+) Transcript_2133:225-926(+)
MNEFDGLETSLTDPQWQALLKKDFASPLFAEIKAFLNSEALAGKTIFPPVLDVFSAFNSTPLSNVKVVIIGQDPYFNPGQGHGLSFSVRKGITIPPSLRRIYTELEADIPGFKRPSHGYLQEWAERGVLLLNATLTVEKGKANSHAKCGWQTFTDSAISKLARHHEGLVFLLWGKFAWKKEELLPEGHTHAVLKTPHPSPLGGSGWNGCKCFSAANEALTERGKDPIDWTLSG